MFESIFSNLDIYFKEAALLHGARMPPVPAFGLGPPGPPGFFSPGISPIHNLHPRMPMPPIGRGLPVPGDSVSTTMW